MNAPVERAVVYGGGVAAPMAALAIARAFGRLGTRRQGCGGETEQEGDMADVAWWFQTRK